ncbi:MAG: DNA polymerase III subunit delta' [Proteobacteria bacterium]|nr:DNA polymerase III subunit delta' [Pseudomonadota bacterium]
MSALLHPREVYALDGAQAAERAWLAAVERGRLHHAWLLAGPEGVGKATFAFRAARRLLGARPASAYGLLGAAPEDPVCRLVENRSHPDLLVLEREGEDGKLKRGISVDEARRLPEFFAKSPSIAAWRVAVIDSADDLNASAANAVLKTLEEPPERGVVLMVSHAPGALLPTLRSRCRRLNFSPWPEQRVAEFVQFAAGLDGVDADRLAALSCGAPGRALRLQAQGALELDESARALFAGGGARQDAAVQALADKLRGGEAAARFALLLELLAEQARAAALRSAGHAPREADQAAAAWARWRALPAEVEGLNLDRAEALWGVAAEARALTGHA